jgi:LPS sulfotransferase NodH
VTVPFALLTTQRTGSSWLTTLLDSHPEADAYGELFLAGEGTRPPWGARGIERFWSFRSAAGARGHRPRRPRITFAYLDHLFASNPTARAIGFKLMYDQAARYPETLFYCVRNRIRMIHLVRTNILDVVISRELMLARGTPHATAEREVTALRVSLDPSSIRRRLRALELEAAFFRRVLRTLRLRHIEVRYDTLVSEPGTIQRVLRFLDLPDDAALHSPLIKMNDRKQSELVENYEAIARALHRTRFASLLTG